MKTEHLIIICITIFMCLVAIGGFILETSKQGYTIRIQMDNNTKEAFQSINYSYMTETKDPEWMHYAPAMNFSCFGMQCSPIESVYIKGIGVCYNKSEGIICPV